MANLTVDTYLPDRERKILDDALAAFATATGLRAHLVTVEPKITATHRPDAIVRLGEAGRETTFTAEIKAVDRATTLAQVQAQLATFEGPGLLVTPYLTPELANRCRQIELPFIDTAGNALLNAPGLYVFIKGEKRPDNMTPMGTQGGGTATALRVVFALLHRPDLLNAPYREIVDTAGVALGAVGWVFFDLEKRGYAAGGKRQRNRRLLETKRLIEEWVTNYPIKLRPKLNPRRFRAADPDWWKEAKLPEGAYWGGEVAADRLTHYLKPATFTIYITPAPDTRRENLKTLIGAHRLRADPTGDIEILDTFWHFQDDPTRPDLVPPLLIYADLIATLDPRNLEVAKLVRERYVEHVSGQG